MDKKIKIRVTDIVRRGQRPDLKHSREAEETLSSLKKEVKHIAHDSEKIEDKIEDLAREETTRFKKEKEARRRRQFTFTNIVLVLAALIALGGTAYSLVEILPRVKIIVLLQKYPWIYNDSVIASKNAATADLQNKIIPGQIFSARKNFTFSYPARGKRQVSRKAAGVISIYNNYSSSAQVLVVKTRFADSSGKIFRLVKAVTVPGAKVSNGKIIPSSVEAEVAAENPGANNNTGPGRLTIPGFQGSPKYSGFYAESKDGIKGGFVGEQAYPTSEDIEKARIEAIQELKDILDSFLSLQIPQNMKVIEGARQFKVVKESHNDEVDEKGNFGYFVEADSDFFAFREADVVSLMASLLGQKEGKDGFNFKEGTVQYGVGRADINQGKLSFTVNFEGKFWQVFDEREAIANLKGRSEDDVRDYLSKLPGRERATVTFWPFWVKRVPNDAERINIEVQ